MVATVPSADSRARLTGYNRYAPFRAGCNSRPAVKAREPLWVDPGEIPEPTVTVRMGEGGRRSCALAGLKGADA